MRPTGLIDPEVVVRPIDGQVDDLLAEIRDARRAGERVLVTTLTKRMAEDLTEYYREVGVKVEYLHSDVETLERVKILRELRKGTFDVLVGVNLLREGLDLPEVSLVAILDADKEGFLRSTGSLIQTIGRAARNVNGKAILYADKRTDSMRAAMDETARRRTRARRPYNARARHHAGDDPPRAGRPACLAGRRRLLDRSARRGRLRGDLRGPGGADRRDRAAEQGDARRRRPAGLPRPPPPTATASATSRPRACSREGFWHPVSAVYLDQAAGPGVARRAAPADGGEGRVEVVYAGDRMWPSIRHGEALVGRSRRGVGSRRRRRRARPIDGAFRT